MDRAVQVLMGSSNHPLTPPLCSGPPTLALPFEPVMRTPAASPDQFDSGRKKTFGFFFFTNLDLRSDETTR